MPTFYGIGRAMVNIFIPVANIPLKYRKNTLIRLSKEDLDLLYSQLEKNKIDKIHKVAGGISANILKTAAYLGSKTFFTGTVGNDENGRLFEEELSNYGVFSFFDRKKKNTGRFVVLTPITPKEKEDEVCFSSMADAMDLDPIQIRTHYLTNCDCVIAEANLMEDAPLWGKLLKICTESQRPLLINVGNPDMAEATALQMLHLQNKVPLIVAGRTSDLELVNLTLKHYDTDFEKITSEGGDFSPMILATEKGHEAKAWFEGQCISSTAISTSGFEEIGAYDCFTGSFITRWFSVGPNLHDKRRKTTALVVDSLDFANEMAQKVRSRYGCALLEN